MKTKHLLPDKNDCKQGHLLPLCAFFPEVPKMPFKVRLVNTVDSFIEFSIKLSQQSWFSFDTETTSKNPRWAKLVGMSFCWSPDEAWYVPVACPKGDTCLSTEYVLMVLQPYFECHEWKKIGQNLKYDAIVLKNYGIELNCVAFDTLIASYLCDAGSQRHNLDLLAQKYLQHDMIKLSSLIGTGQHQLSTQDVPLECMAPYAAEDAWAVALIAPILYKEVENQGLTKLLEHLELPLVSVLAEMEYNGIKIDRKAVDELHRDFSTRILAAESLIKSLTSDKFNPNSPKQLQEELFERQGIRPIKATPGGECSTDQSVLEELAKDYELPKAIMEYRGLSKLDGTYVSGLPAIIHPETGRVHASFNQGVTATGRLSSSDPNLQNIPSRTEDGKKIRKVFVAEKNHVLVAADYSQIELRVLAHYSSDPVLLQAFYDDVDVHAQVTAKMRKVSLDQVTDDMRKVCKNLNFGVLYGQGPKRLAKSLDITKEEARFFIDEYFREFPSIKKLRNSVIALCARQGHVSTILGRKRRISGFHDPAYKVRSRAERQAFNTVIQGSAADIIKLAMLECDKAIKQGEIHAKMLLQVHDELVFEVHKNDREEVCSLINQIMVDVIELKVPLKVDVEYGPSWGEQELYETPINNTL